MKFFFLTCCISFFCLPTLSQDSIPAKVHHAEPLYIDLIRDLGARKGEREWNIGGGIDDKRDYLTYSSFIEYEFAPVNRLGLEVEIPFKIFHPINTSENNEDVPHNKIEGIKLAAQYTFLVSKKRGLSMATAFTSEIGMHSFYTMRKQNELIKENLYSPVAIIAKRWGEHLHSMIYTGPVFVKENNGNTEQSFQFNASMHYMIPHTSHIIGMELNQEFHREKCISYLRPQVKIKVSSSTAIGFVFSIPCDMKESGMGLFTRIIYEPSRKK